MDNKKKTEDLHFSDPVFEQFLQKEKLISRRNDTPLVKLKQMLLYNILLAVVVILVYFLLMRYVAIWQIKASLAVVIVFCLWCLYQSLKLYFALNTEIVVTNSVLAELKRHYNAFNRWMLLNQRAALFIYPFSVTAGFLLGGAVGSGKAVEDFIYKPYVIVALVICIAVLEPVSYYLARWLFKMLFGAQMNALKNTIAELERV